MLDLGSLFYYMLSMKDKNISIKRSSDYCLKILEIYDLESSYLRKEDVLICFLHVCRI